MASIIFTMPFTKLSAEHTFVCHPQTKRGFATIVSTTPKGDQLVYVCGSNVVLRSTTNAMEVTVVNDKHKHPVTAARVSPTGYFCASGDAQGNVVVWATDNEEHTTKLETRALSGAVHDICWSPDGKRIIVVGDGQERFGHCFLMDTGSSVGEITGHSAVVLACDFKPTRPFAVATCGQDMLVNLYRGPPFKFHKSSKDHTNYVHCVRFSPDGETLASVASDSKINMFDAKELDFKTCHSDANGHKGTIYSLSWGPDSKSYVTAGADKTVKVWNAENGTVVRTYTFDPKPQVHHMQVGSVWSADGTIVSLSLHGCLYFLSPDSEDVRMTLQGHSSPVLSVAPLSGNRIVSGDNDGRVCVWNASSGSTPYSGYVSSHSAAVLAIEPVTGHDNMVLSCGTDDKIVAHDLEAQTQTTVCSLVGTPNSISTTASVGVISTSRSVSFLSIGDNVSLLGTVDISEYDPTCVSIRPDGAEVAIGAKNMKVYVYDVVDGNTINIASPKKVIERHRGAVTCVKYSPNSEFLCTADANREIVVWNAANGSYDVKCSGWQFHTAKVTSVAWSPDSQHVASGAVDTHIIVWSLATPTKRVRVDYAHKNGGVRSVRWMDDATLVSCGQDCNIRTWKLSA